MGALPFDRPLRSHASAIVTPGPFFVIGQARGGTTLARDILKAHPLIDGPRGESHFYLRYNNRYGDLHDDGSFDRLLSDFFGYEYFFGLSGLDERDLRARLVGKERRYKVLLEETMNQYLASSSSQAWVEKSPDHLFHLEAILADFPRARFLQVVRDCRDLIASTLARLEKSASFTPSQRSRRIVSIALDWQSRVHLGLRNLHKYPPDRYLFVRYEDVVACTDAFFRRLTVFTGLQPPFTPEMIAAAAGSMWGVLTDGVNSSFGDLGEVQDGRAPLTSQPIGRYKTFLSADEVALVQALVGPALAALAYPLEGRRLPLSRMGDLLAQFLTGPGKALRFLQGRYDHFRLRTQYPLVIIPSSLPDRLAF